MTQFRKPAVAGLFYSAENKQLVKDVQVLLARAKHQTCLPKALIVPHAGYVYSGSVAAAAYATLNSIAGRIRRVVLLGPAHRFAFSGVALPDADAFTTPLGEIKLDVGWIRKNQHLSGLLVSRAAHEFEHALEVQLPFLQCVLNDFVLLPLVVGMTTVETVAEILENAWGGEETLIVVSSDLSHYLPYEVAQQVDQQTIRGILQLQLLADRDQACGSMPINGLIMAARKHHLTPQLLDSCNSGDTAGERTQVVGYASIAFTDIKVKHAS